MKSKAYKIISALIIIVQLVNLGIAPAWAYEVDVIPADSVEVQFENETGNDFSSDIPINEQAVISDEKSTSEEDSSNLTDTDINVEILADSSVETVPENTDENKVTVVSENDIEKNAEVTEKNAVGSISETVDCSEFIISAGGMELVSESELKDALVNESTYNDVEKLIIDKLTYNDTFIDLKKFNLTNEQFRNIYITVMNGHPEISWFADSSYIADIDYNLGRLNSVTLLVYASDKMIADFNRRVQQILDMADKSCRSDSELDKAAFLFRYLSENVSYSDASDDQCRYDAYGAIVNGSAVCQGYTEAYQLLLKKMGIDCRVVTSTSMNHAWNAVKVDGEWYHADVTWGLNYFLKSDSGIIKHYNWEIVEGTKGAYQPTEAIKCTSTKYDSNSSNYICDFYREGYGNYFNYYKGKYYGLKINKSSGECAHGNAGHKLLSYTIIEDDAFVNRPLQSYSMSGNEDCELVVVNDMLDDMLYGAQVNAFLINNNYLVFTRNNVFVFDLDTKSYTALSYPQKVRELLSEYAAYEENTRNRVSISRQTDSYDAAENNYDNMAFKLSVSLSKINDQQSNQNKDITFTLNDLYENRTSSETVLPPEIMKVSDTSVMLKYTVGYEYRLGNDGKWQDSYIFTDLSPDTTYYIYQRKKATATTAPSGISNSVAVKTRRRGVKVTFDFLGGENSAYSASPEAYDFVRYPGETYFKLPTTSKTGNTFDGWYTDKTNGVKVTADTVVTIENDHTLYARWNEKNVYVYFNSDYYNENGEYGSNPNPKAVTYKGKFGTLPVPKRPGYKFAGWWKNISTYDSTTGKWTTSEIQITADTTVDSSISYTLYAKWEVDEFSGYRLLNGKWHKYERGVDKGVADNKVVNTGTDSSPVYKFVKSGSVVADFTWYAWNELDNKYHKFNKGNDTGFWTGMVYIDRFYYAAKGSVNTSYTGLAYKLEDGKFHYMKNGRIDNTFTGPVYYINYWHRVKSGVDQGAFNGIMYDTYNNVWIYTEGGIKATGFTGPVYSTDRWYRITKGAVIGEYNGIMYDKYNNQTIYCVGGKKAASYTGKVYSVDRWYDVKAGVSLGPYTGLMNDTYNNVWIYTVNGQRQNSFNGIYNQWCIKNGAIYSFTGLWEDKGKGTGWWYVENGKVNTAYNDIFYTPANVGWLVLEGRPRFKYTDWYWSTKYGWKYIKDGKVQ